MKYYRSEDLVKASLVPYNQGKHVRVKLTFREDLFHKLGKRVDVKILYSSPSVITFSPVSSSSNILNIYRMGRDRRSSRTNVKIQLSEKVFVEKIQRKVLSIPVDACWEGENLIVNLSPEKEQNVR